MLQMLRVTRAAKLAAQAFLSEQLITKGAAKYWPTRFSPDPIR
jgi:hypothetical protein